jgi:hypothetical protein
LAVINKLGEKIMTNRTVQFYGKGYGAEPAEILVEMGDTIVFDGVVSTINQATYDQLPEQQEILFTCELPVEFSGSIPMVITVNSGTVVFAHVHANRSFPGQSITTFLPIIHGTDARSNVFINGISQKPAWDNAGTWSWTVSRGDSLTYDLNVVAGSTF